jgi:hypothetical protein
MELCIKENGIQRAIKEMEEECKFGQMVHAMMDSGKTEWLAAMVDSYMLKVTFMKELGMRIKLTDLVSTLTTMVVDMKVNGSTTNSTEMESKNGQMVHNTKVNMLKE